MKRLLLAVLGLFLCVPLIWLLAIKDGSSSAQVSSVAARSAPEQEASEAAFIGDTSERAARQRVPEAPSPLLALAGKAVLSDETPIGNLRLRAVLITHSDLIAATTITDASGAFRFTPISTGQYRIGTVRAEGLGPPQGVFEAGDESISLVFNAFRVFVTLQDLLGRVVEGGKASLMLDGKSPQIMTSDPRGRVSWYVRSPGTAVITAYSPDGSLFGELLMDVHYGTSNEHTVLILRPTGEFGSISVSTQCKESKVPTPFAVHLYDAEAQILMRTALSDALSPALILTELSHRRYRVELADRFREPTSAYLENPYRVVDLSSTTEAKVEFLVRCGGRVQLTVRDRNRQLGSSNIMIRKANADEWESLLVMYAPNGSTDTLRMGSVVPLNTLVETSEPLEPGTYSLKASSEGRESLPLTLEVRSERRETVELLISD